MLSFIFKKYLVFYQHLDELAKDEKVSPRVILNKLGGSALIRKEPLGVVLIIGK
jgi:hypothetical protein